MDVTLRAAQRYGSKEEQAKALLRSGIIGEASWEVFCALVAGGEDPRDYMKYVTPNGNFSPRWIIPTPNGYCIYILDYSQGNLVSYAVCLKSPGGNYTYGTGPFEEYTKDEEKLIPTLRKAIKSYNTNPWYRKSVGLKPK